ncbi:MAG: GNAT family N-acetyltransferase, partial [Pseudomonadota bacterium]
MNIQAAELRHLPELAGLFDAYRQFYEMPPDLKACEAYLRDRMEAKESIIFVSENANGQLDGFVQLYHSFCSVEMIVLTTLYDLYVL